MSEDKLNIELEAFTGPFDLLLKLIEKNKIDIYDINIEEITTSYLEEISKIKGDINNLSEFIYIASILLNIKANRLMPKEDSNDLEEEFIAYLLAYKEIKSVEDDFKYMENEARKIYSKYQEDLSQFEREERVYIEKDINILTREFEKIIKNIEKREHKPVLRTLKQIDVNNYVEKIRKTLNFTKTLDLKDITTRIKSKDECIATFLALLELVKLKEITLEDRGINSFWVVKR